MAKSIGHACQSFWMKKISICNLKCVRTLAITEWAEIYFEMKGSIHNELMTNSTFKKKDKSESLAL